MAQTLRIIGLAERGAVEALRIGRNGEVRRVPLVKNRYGKGRCRVMRIHRDGDKHEVSRFDVGGH